MHIILSSRVSGDYWYAVRWFLLCLHLAAFVALLCFIVQDTLPDFLTPHASICYQTFPGLGLQSYNFEILFAYIFEMELGPANWSLAGEEFSIEDIFWNPSILHPGEVTKPLQTSLLQHGKHGVNACHLWDSVVCYAVSPCNAKNAPTTLHMKGIKSLFLMRL